MSHKTHDWHALDDNHSGMNAAGAWHPGYNRTARHLACHTWTGAIQHVRFRLSLTRTTHARLDAKLGLNLRPSSLRTFKKYLRIQFALKGLHCWVAPSFFQTMGEETVMLSASVHHDGGNKAKSPIFHVFHNFQHQPLPYFSQNHSQLLNWNQWKLLSCQLVRNCTSFVRSANWVHSSSSCQKGKPCRECWYSGNRIQSYSHPKLFWPYRTQAA